MGPGPPGLDIALFVAFPLLVLSLRFLRASTRYDRLDVLPRRVVGVAIAALCMVVWASVLAMSSGAGEDVPVCVEGDGAAPGACRRDGVLGEHFHTSTPLLLCPALWLAAAVVTGIRWR